MVYPIKNAAACCRRRRDLRACARRNLHLIDTGGTAVGTQARQGFEAAAFYWSSVLKNKVAVNLNIGFSTLGTGILGSTSSTSTLEFNSLL